ncbi:hypothetical protein [Kineosporia sp. R_H_3]|uniref:hypothetical protein n=1 Tax=Kineosporia sp. R_H_3 TaxID=1961848 RepID=UPI000B4B5B4A|nr:hypothetical protein [Kineosporia sp. R_H_3]
MRWEDLFADLEASVDAEDRAEFEAEVADLARTERALLSLADRLRGHDGCTLTFHLAEGDEVTGRLHDVGRDWVAVTTGTRSALVPLAAVVGVDGLTRAAAAPPDPDGPPPLRVGLGTALRVLARDRAYVRLRLRGGTVVAGTVDRVGADHLDVAVHPADEPRRAAAVSRVRCVPFGAVVVVRGDAEHLA